MARPGDWSALGLSKDPTPGDPDELDRVLTSQYKLIELARTIDSGLAEVSNKASEAFKGKTADALRGKIDGRIRGFVTTFKTAHEDVRTALLTYVGVMRAQQRIADDALTAAQALPEDDKAGRDAHKATAQSAGDTLETAASTAATALATASESISSPVDECEDLWKALTWIAIILIIPAIIVGGPVALLAFGLNLAIMIKTAIDFSRGDAGLTELILSIVGVLAPTTKGLNVGQAWTAIKGFGAQGLKGIKNLALGGPNSFGLFGRMTLGLDDTFSATGSWLKGGLGDAIKFNQIKGLQGVHILGGGSGRGFQFFPLGVQLGMINNIGGKAFFGLHSLIVGLNGIKIGAGAIANGLSGFKGLRLFLPVAADEMGQGLFLAFKIGFIDRGIFGMYRYGAFVNGSFIGAGSKVSGVGAGAFNFFDAGNGGGLGLIKAGDFHFAPGAFGSVGGPGGLGAPGSMIPLGQFAVPPSGISLSMPTNLSVHLGEQGGFSGIGQINLPSIDARLADLPVLGLNGSPSLPTLGPVTQINVPGGLGGLPNLGSVPQSMPALGQVNIPQLGFSPGQLPSVTLDTPSLNGNLGGLGQVTVSTPSLPALGHISVPSLGTAGAGNLGLIRTELPGINAQIVDLPSVGTTGQLGQVQLGQVQLGSVHVPSLGLNMPHFSASNVTPALGDLATPNVNTALGNISVPNAETHLGQIDVPAAHTGPGQTDLTNVNPGMGHVDIPNAQTTLVNTDLPTVNTGAVQVPGLGRSDLALTVPPPTTHLTPGALAAPGVNGTLADIPTVLPGSGQLINTPNTSALLNSSAFSGPNSQFFADILASMNREPLTVFMAPNITYNFQHTFTQLPNMPAGVQVQVTPGTAGQLVNVQVTTPAGMQGIVHAMHLPVNGQDVLRIHHTQLDGTIQRLDYELSAANNHQLLNSQTITPAQLTAHGIQMQTFGPNTVAGSSAVNLPPVPSGSGAANLVPQTPLALTHGVPIPGLTGTNLLIRTDITGQIVHAAPLPGGVPVNVQHLAGAGPGGVDIVRVEQTVTAGAEFRRWEFTANQAGNQLITNERRFHLNDGALNGGVISIDLVPAVNTIRHLDAAGTVQTTGGRPIQINATSLNIPTTGGFHLYDPATGLQTHTGLNLIGANGTPTPLHVLTPQAPPAGGAVPPLSLTGADGATQLGTVTVPANAGGVFHVRPTPAPGTAAVPHLSVYQANGTFSHDALPVPAVNLAGGAGPAFVRLPDNAGGLPQVVHADGSVVPGANIHPQGTNGANGFQIEQNGQHLVVSPAGVHTHDVVSLQGPGVPATGQFVFSPTATPNVPLPQLRDQNGTLGAQVARVDGTYHVDLGHHQFAVHTPTGAYSHQALGVGGLATTPPGGAFLRADPANPGGSLLVRGDGTQIPGATVHPQGNTGFRIDHNNQHIAIDTAGTHTHDVVTLNGPGVPAIGQHVFTPVATPNMPVAHPRAGNGAVDTTLTVQRTGGEFRLTDAQGTIRAFDPTTGALIRTDVPVSGGTALDGNFIRTDAAGTVTVVRADFSAMPGAHATPQTGMPGGGFRLDQGNTHLVLDPRGAHAYTAVELHGPGAAGGTGHYVFQPTAPGAAPHMQVKDGTGADLPDTVTVRPDGNLQVTAAGTISVHGATDGAFQFSLLRLTDAAGTHLPQTVRVYGAGGIRLLDHQQNVIDAAVVTVRPGGGFRVEDASGEFALHNAAGQLDFRVTPVAHATDNSFTVTPTVGNAFTVIPLGDAVKLTDAGLSRFVDITPGAPRLLDGNLSLVPGRTVTPQPGGGWRVDGPGNLRQGEFTQYAADGTLTVQRINVVTKGQIKANNHLELYHVATPGAGGNPAGTWKLIRTDGTGAVIAGSGSKWFQNGLINTKGLPQGRIHLTTHSGVTVFEARPLPNGNTLNSFQSSASADVTKFSMGNQRGEWHEIGPQGQLIRNGDRHWGESGRSWWDSTGTAGVNRVLHFQQLPDGGHVLGTLNRNVFNQSMGDGVWFRFDADFKMIAQGTRAYGPGLGRGFTDRMDHPLTGQSMVIHEKFGRFQPNTHDVRRLFQREMGADGVPKVSSVSLSAPGKEIDSLKQLENNGGLLEVKRVAEQRPPNWFRYLISSEYRTTDLGPFSYLKGDSLPQLNEWRIQPAPGSAATGSHGIRLLTQNAAITDISSTGQLVREMRKLFHGNDLTVGNVKVPTDGAGAPVAIPNQYLPWSEGVGKLQGHRTFNHADFQAPAGTNINVNQVIWHDRFTTNLGDGDWFSPNAAKQWEITRTGLNDGTVIEYRPNPAVRPDGAAGNGDLAFRQNFHMNNGDWTRYDHHGFVVARTDTWPGVGGGADLRITAHGPATGKMTWVDANNPHINGVRITAHGRDINYYGWDRESYQDFGIDGRLIRDHRLLADGTTVDAWRVSRDAAGNEVWHWNKIDAHGNIKVFGTGAGDQVRHWIDARGNPLPGWAKDARWSDEITSLASMKVQEIPARPDAGAIQNFLGDKPFRVREYVADPGGNFNAHVWKEFDIGAVVRQKKELLNGNFLESESWQKHWRLYGTNGTNLIAERSVSGWIYETNAFGQLKLIGRETNFIDWANQYRGYTRMWKDPNRWEFGPTVGGESTYRPFITKSMQNIALDAGHEFVVDFALSLAVLGIAALVTGARFTATDVAKAAFGAMMGTVVKSFVTALHHAAGRGTPWKNGWGHVDYGYPYQRHPGDDDWGGEWAGHDKVTRWRGGVYDFGVGVGTGVLSGFASGASSAATFGVKTASGELIHLAKADAAIAGLMSAVGGTIGGLSIGAARSLIHLNLAGRWYHRAGMVDIYLVPAIGKLIDKSFSAFFMGSTVRDWFHPSWYTDVPIGGAGNSTLLANATDIPGPGGGYANLFHFDLDNLPQGAGTP